MKSITSNVQQEKICYFECLVRQIICEFHIISSIDSRSLNSHELQCFNKVDTVMHHFIPDTEQINKFVDQSSKTSKSLILMKFTNSSSDLPKIVHDRFLR